MSRLLSGLLAIALPGVVLVPGAAPATAEPLAEVGPVDNTNGYPFWFGDDGDAGEGLAPIRLELCVDDVPDPLCPVVGERPDSGRPPSVPENFPDESFWWSGEAAVDAPSGASALLVMAQEAAFGGPGDVAFGQQVAFQRLRIRIDDAVPLATYTVTTPYGVREVEADDQGQVRMTDDRGCLSPSCGDFAQAKNGPIGPFLRWDEGAPEGYVGDPNVEHRVVGSPTGDNFFRVEGPGLTSAGALDGSIETDLFAVQGRIATPRATISHPGDLYEPGTTVTITSSFPGESQVAYTLDGSDPLDSELAETVPAPSGTGAVPVTLPAVEGPVTLRYAVLAGGATSEVYEQVYTLRSGLATVAATPGPAEPGAVLEGRQDVELTSSLPGTIYYTTDGSRPRINASDQPLGTTSEYTDPIRITRTTFVRAFALPDAVEPLPDATEPPPAPQAGPVAAFHYVIHNLREVSSVDSDGYPFSLTDIGLPAAEGSGGPRTEPVELELCLDDPLCPVVGELPDPTRGVSFPDNFPDESFWWSGEAAIDGPNGERARLVLAAEAAFDGEAVQDDHQIAFGRIRVRMDAMVPLATYEIVHPYGVVRATADDRGRVAYTDDVGCMTGPCGFEKLLTQPVGPFLRWDEGAPAGYVGDPNIPHTVVGSPYDTNEFVVHQVTDGNGDEIVPELFGRTDEFAVQGKLAGPGVIANWQTGTFNHPLSVTLEGNHLTSEIRYTLDGTDPATGGEDYDGPIQVTDGTTILRYVGIGDGETSAMEEEIYTVDTTAPTVSASPAGGEFPTAQNVRLSTNDPTAQVFYTVDGSVPTLASTQYAGGSIPVASSLRLQAIAVDGVGNVSAPRSWDFTITSPAPTGPDTGTDPGTGTGTGTGTTTPPGPTGSGLIVQQGSTGPIDAGRTTTLSGVLAPAGQVISGAPVVLQARAVITGGRAFVAPQWVEVATTTTAADGSYVFARLEPTATTDYRVVFRGDSVNPPIVSATQRVEVRAVVTLSRPDRRVERGDRATFRGKLGPTLRGATVVVKLDGPGSRTEKVRATVDRDGKWKATLRTPRRTGKWTVVAKWRGDAGLLADTSATRTFRVVR